MNRDIVSIGTFVRFYSEVGRYMPSVYILRKNRARVYFPSEYSIYRLQKIVNKMIQDGTVDVVVPRSVYVGWRIRRKDDNSST